MKTVIFIQVLYILIHFEFVSYMVSGASEKCESSIETRAVLISCPEKDTGCEDDDPLSKATQADEYRLLQVKPSEMRRVKAEIEREFPNRVTECKRKLVITMKLNNKGKIECDDGFIVIDHVYDPITRGKARLLSPVIIKLRQEQMVQLYPLQFQKVVNSNPNENIFTKETCSIYDGCSTSLDNPTCGITTYDGEPIPFSEGFCCSCDPYVNAMREVLPEKHENAFRYKDPSLFGYEKNRMTRSREKTSVIVNPYLLKMKANNRQGVRHVAAIEEDDTDQNALDELVRTPPNFFFERDRQIVCAPEALLKELCNVDGKDSDGKDDDEAGDDDAAGGSSSDDFQFKHLNNYNQGDRNNSNNDNNKEDSNEKSGSEECNNFSQKEDGSNASKGNCSDSHNAATESPSDKNTPKEENHKIEKDTLYGINRYLDAVGRDNGGQFQFTGNNKFIAMPSKSEEGEVNGIEIMHGKRETRNSPPKHREKRLTRESEEYAVPYQYPSEMKVRRSKRILDAAERKMSGSRGEEKYSADADMETGDGGDGCAPSSNCTLPIFFFSHDKNILCPPCSQNKSCQTGNSANPEYEDSNLNTGNESENENEGDNENESDSDNVDETPESEEPPPPPPPPPASMESKVMRLHTNKAGTWDVNANVRHGNIFRLDLIKQSDKDDSPDHADKIEEINYEQKHFPPDMDEQLKAKLIQKFRETAGVQRYRIGNGGNKIYSDDDRIYAQQQKMKEMENRKYPGEFVNVEYPGKKDQQYGPQSQMKGNPNEYKEESGKLQNLRKDAQIPDSQRGYGKVSSDANMMRKTSFGDKKSQKESVGEGKVSELEPQSGNPQRYGYEDRLSQSRKAMENGKADDGYYGRMGESAWKKSYYPRYGPTWSDRYYPRSKSSGRDNIVDLLASNYPRTNDMDSQYLVSSKNVFFADSKQHRSMRTKDMRPYQGHQDRFYDEREDLHERDRSRQRQSGREGQSAQKYEEGAVYYKDDAGNYFDGFRHAGRETSDEDSFRNRRRAGKFREGTKRFYSEPDHAFGDFQKLRNPPVVRKRRKRSIGGELMQEQTLKINEWQHRTPPGPEYQFDVSTLTRPNRPYSHASGGGGKQCLSDIQKNFAKLKPRSGRQGKEWEEAKRETRMKIDQRRLMQSYLTSPPKYKREVHNDVKGKRHAKAGRRQERGGQDCSEGFSTVVPTTGGTTTTCATSAQPEKADSHDSTHCMKLSDLWYSVYQIKRPELSQLVGVQIYDKQTMCDGTTNWRDVTKGYMIRLGSFLQRAEDDVPTISMTFTPTGPNVDKDEPKLDTENYRLLIPSHLTNEKKASFYPEFYGGPSEFMLVRKEDISDTGRDCNKIGTSFEAFARQPDRCSKPPGSCLKRQPVDLWREDMEARIRDKRGKYFIENFGNVSNTSIKSYSNLTGDFLAMDYYGEYSSVLEIEMRADGNAIVRQGENAQIPSVYIDSMSSRKTKIVLSVMNMGLTSSLFRPRLGECPPNLDPTWCPLEGPLVLIPPQQRHDFKLELSGTLPAKKVHCAVEVLNHYNKKVARRRIVIKRADRCFCSFYCKCICIAGTKRFTCSQLSKEDYNAAGYFDSIPQRSSPSSSGAEAFLENLKVVLISMVYALFVLGVIKAILGLFWRRLGTAGVQVIVGPRTLCQYYERDIACYQVVYDECGFPIHPQTCKTVQVVPMWLEMFINFLFFYLYLIKVLWLLISSMPCCKSVCNECEVCYRLEESEEDTNKSKSSKNYSANYFTYNVMTFTSKKTKPEENALYNPYKADEDPLEEDDTEFVLEEIKRYKHKNSDE